MAVDILDVPEFKKYLRPRIAKAMMPVKASAQGIVALLKEGPYARRRGKIYRIRGVVRDAIRVRKSKNAEKAGNVGSFVNVKPLPGNKYRKVGKQVISVKGGQRTVGRFLLVKKSLRTNTKEGFNNPLDPYYWKFLELGASNRGLAPRPFLKPAGRMLPGAIDRVNADIKAYIERRAK